MSANGLREKVGSFVFLRIIVPVLPVIIQYFLHLLGIYRIENFPQITFIASIFGLSLALLLERRGSGTVVTFSVIPAIVASILYTTALLVGKDGIPQMAQGQLTGATLDQFANAEHTVLLVGLGLWLMLLVINIVLVLIEYWLPQQAAEDAT